MDGYDMAEYLKTIRSLRDELAYANAALERERDYCIEANIKLIKVTSQRDALLKAAKARMTTSYWFPELVEAIALCDAADCEDQDKEEG